MCSVPLGCGLVPGISAEGFMELSGSALIKRVALFRLGVVSSAVLEQQNCLCREPGTEEQEGNF